MTVQADRIRESPKNKIFFGDRGLCVSAVEGHGASAPWVQALPSG